ncbi:MAG TPA: ATP-grasp domain-containing protein, partial [Opitutaceae bacterium]
NRSRAVRALPGDEDALVYLKRVQTVLRRSRLAGLFKCAASAIAGGVPSLASSGQLLSRTFGASIADRCGIASPPWASCSDRTAIAALCSDHGFPFVLKRDDTSAGMGVRVCNDGESLGIALAGCQSAGIVQSYVPGIPAMQAAVALDGRLLGTCGWVKERCFPEPFGPSAIVARIDDDSMKRAAAAFAAESGFNGFFSLDFIVGEGAPLLIEINPRPTPVCHLGGLAGALAAALGAPQADTRVESPARLAVFPQELRRNPGSANDDGLVHDLPHDDPPLLRALCDAFLNGNVPTVRRSLAR